MTARARLASFAAVLALAFGAAALAGGAFGPKTEAEPAHGGSSASAHEGEAGDHHAMAAGRHGAGEAGGLSVSQGGYTLSSTRTFFQAGRLSQLAFRILDPRGATVRTGFELESERQLHLIVVRRDGRAYQHLHPVRDTLGTWSIPLTLPTAGVYRAYADFRIAGERRTLATDLFVPGDFRPQPLPAPSPTASSDGYQVALETNTVRAGSESELTFRVTRNGRPVRQLQPYLGAKGHLVALREGDLAYLHVHPDAARLAADEVRFMAEFPSAARYRLFLQFKAAGQVHTVAYTLEVSR
jgi:hypothetical protein